MISRLIIKKRNSMNQMNLMETSAEFKAENAISILQSGDEKAIKQARMDLLRQAQMLDSLKGSPLILAHFRTFLNLHPADQFPHL
tara:strand:- start:43 stop:297 length:255 start_codon:yes stop_codon:yes gene_type:complete